MTYGRTPLRALRETPTLAVLSCVVIPVCLLTQMPGGDIFASESAAFKTPGSDGSLTLISEDGIHLNTRLQYADGLVEWLGYRSALGTPIGPGEIDFRDRSDKIRFYVMLPADSQRLRQARDETVTEFRSSQYRINNHNCVVFGSRMAQRIRYDVRDAFDVGRTPEEVVKLFADKFRVQAIYNVRPFPWIAGSTVSGSQRMAARIDWIHCHKPETVFGTDRVYLRTYHADRLVFESDERRPMNRGDRWQFDTVVATLDSGMTIAIQLWDDDRVDRDDLIFDQTIPVGGRETLVLKRKKGERLLGSESIYEMQISIVPL